MTDGDHQWAGDSGAGLPCRELGAGSREISLGRRAAKLSAWLLECCSTSFLTQRLRLPKTWQRTMHQASLTASRTPSAWLMLLC